MVKAILLKNNNTLRVISGTLLDELDIDWGMEPLDSLQAILAIVLVECQDRLHSLADKEFSELLVFKGGSHLDIVDKNEGSLDLLFVADHPIKNLE